MARRKEKVFLTSQTIHEHDQLQLAVAEAQASAEATYVEKDVQLISPVTGFSNAISSCVGVGVLALSQSFQQGSLVVGLIMFAIATVTSLISCQMFVEAASRYWFKKRGTYKLANDTYATSSQLCRDLPKKRAFGRVFSILFQVCNSIYLFANLLETSSTAAQSVVADLPIKYLKDHNCTNPATYDSACKPAFWATLMIGTAILTMIALFDLRKLSLLFNIFSLWRWFIVAILIYFCSKEIHTNGGVSASVNYTHVDIYSFSAQAPAVIFAFMWQASIGVVYEPIRSKEKNLLPLFLVTNAAMTAMYVIITLLGQFAFGEDILSMLVYNFRTMRLDSMGLKVLSQFAILYPPFVYFASSPFSVQPLATQVLEWFPEKYRTRPLWVSIIRVFAAFIPAIFAGFITTFSIIQKITGFFAYAIMFIFPAIMLLTSNDLKAKTNSPYYKWWISTPIQWGMIILGTFFLCLIFVPNK